MNELSKSKEGKDREKRRTFVSMWIDCSFSVAGFHSTRMAVELTEMTGDFLRIAENYCQYMEMN